MTRLDTDAHYDGANAKRLPQTPLSRELVAITRTQAFRLVDQVENAKRHAHRWKLQRAADLLADALNDWPTGEAPAWAARELILDSMKEML